MSDERGIDLVQLVANALDMTRYTIPDKDVPKVIVAALEPHIQQRERAAKVEVLETISKDWGTHWLLHMFINQTDMGDECDGEPVMTVAELMQEYLAAATTGTEKDATCNEP